MSLPALRPVDLIPFEHEGETLVCLQDSTGDIENQLVLPPAAAFVSLQLDGVNDVPEVVEAFRIQFEGMELPEEVLEQIVDQLDIHGFLFNDTYERLRLETESNFLSNPVRPAYLAGKSYPEDPDELRIFLDGQFMREGGPGEYISGKPGSGTPLKGLVVPHIDFNRGGHGYAFGYREFYSAGKPDTVIIFGVAHAMEPVPFIMTRKDFETPLGIVNTDTELVAQLAESCSWDPFEFEMTHRTEHSIEFQALMLSYLYGSDVKIVPILVSYFGDEGALASDEELEPLHKFLKACSDCVTSSGKRVSVIASVDMAHVGRCFGDTFDIDDTVIGDVRERDEEDLAYLKSPNPKKFFHSVMQDDNQRHVCGLNALYATLKTLEGVVEQGERLHYDYAHDPAGGIVSFTSYALR